MGKLENKKNQQEKGHKKKDQAVIKKTLKYMIKTAWQQKPSIFLMYGLQFVAQLIQKIQIVLLPKFLMDELMLVIGGKTMNAHVKNVICYAALICGMSLISNLMNNIVYQWRAILEEWFNEYFETLLADYTMKMDFEHTEDPAVLEQLNRAKEGIGWYSGGVTGVLNSVYDMILNVTVLAGVTLVISMTCPLLLPVQVLALFLITFLNAKKNRIEIEQHKQLAKTNRVFGYYFYQLADFSYGKEIRLYDSGEMMCQKAGSINKEMIATWRNGIRKQRTYSWRMDMVNAVRDGVSYFYMGLLAITKRITIGDFSMCVAAASELYQGMWGMVYAWQEIVKRCIYACQFLDFLEYPEALSKGDRKVIGEKHIIEFSHVSFRYPRSEQYVLKDINLKIENGEHLSVVGLNGAGKTTFIKLLCRLYDVTEGEILIDGVNIKEYSEEEYRKLFAVVFQDFRLFAFSLRENIAFGADAREEDINHVLELSGFYEDAKKLPEGLDTMLYKSFDEHGTELSGGQQQKTAIARALYWNAPIVILDEPTAALDPVAEYDIYRHFDCMVGNKTAIYISHRLSSCKFCDRIAVFADSTIKEYGTHSELVNKKDGIYAELFAAQAQYYVEAI
ncbi:MAG: ABC transporter ATP-binding protein [Acetatifactor sp.]